MLVNTSKGINQTLDMMGTGDRSLHQWEWQTSLTAKGPCDGIGSFVLLLAAITLEVSTYYSISTTR
jgi:hypothetical protein